MIKRCFTLEKKALLLKRGQKDEHPIVTKQNLTKCKMMRNDLHACKLTDLKKCEQVIYSAHEQRQRQTFAKVHGSKLS